MIYVENELIGRRLQRIRKDLGYTYEEMGEVLEVSDGQYRKLERGIYAIDVRKVILMYTRLGVDPLYLLTGNCNRIDEDKKITYEVEDNNSLVCELLDYCKTKLQQQEEME
ncbi:MAG: helix-turn-helix transcriptional regulator [Eubacterium sp.]|nr:helix-turn-helix transcriptional regulator [Eubacterium sp.]